MFTYLRSAVLTAIAAVLLIACSSTEKDRMNKEFTSFLDDFESKLIPLAKDAHLAYFNATIFGKDEDYTRAADLEVALTKLFTDKNVFARLQEWKKSGQITDPLLKRQLEVLHSDFFEKQIDEQRLEAMIRMQNEMEKKFSTFRATVKGKAISDNDIEDILRTSTDSKELEEVWTASKAIGGVVSGDVIALVKMRNEAARELGFDNYHSMRLELDEQDPEEIALLFDELDELTRGAFAKLKQDMDAELATRYNIAPEKLMPWHYQNRFFQEAPRIYDVDLDAFYKDKDIVALTNSYYAGMQLPIEDLVKNSDLFEKEGKYQHAYCTDIDREGDVRVVCNIKPTYNWMNTNLHEFGHAVYDKFSDKNLPYLLREPAHTFTTEAIAMLFGRQASNPGWLMDVAGVPAANVDKVALDMKNSLRLEQLVFSRWAQVMYRFEKAMYDNPDQDLNALWWQLVERYQMLRKPEGRNAPDWASKIHVALYPAYYHNYLMGELLASQLHSYLCTQVVKSTDPVRESFAGKADVGAWLRKNIFQPGRTKLWNDMITAATGEKLTAKYYAKQFVE
jgi:peptidyl-dipeptidase A